LTKTWGVPWVYFSIFKPVKTGENRPVQPFQPVRSGTGPAPVQHRSGPAGPDRFRRTGYNSDV